MSVLLINPPLMLFDSIYSSVPLLLGQLRGNNISADLLDMNIAFIKEITSPRYIKYTKNILLKIYKDSSVVNKNVNHKYKLTENQIQELHNNIEMYLFEKQSNINRFLKFKHNFYDIYIKNRYGDKYKNSIDYQIKHRNIFQFLLNFAFLPFYPEKIHADKYDVHISCWTENSLYRQNYDDIIDKCTNKKRNIYINIFEKKIKQLKLNKYDIIAITIPFEQNLYPALTLSKILKENTKAKVVIGGITPSNTIDGFINHPDMFGTFFDHILTKEGETSIVDYVNYVENKKHISNVSGLVYKENNIIKRNDIIPLENINNIYPPDYFGVNFNDYSSKYISIELAKGCYWHKCSFCYNHLWKKYYPRNPIQAVDILEQLSNKYDIHNFCILDDAVSPSFAEKFSDEIIKRNLKIKYTCFMRIDEALSYEIIEKMKKAGNAGIFFGIDSGSEHTLKLMNKGINLKTAERILDDCYKLDIYTNVGIIYGFPTETKEDIIKTIDFVNRNKNKIKILNNYVFQMTKSSALLTEENRKKLQITNIIQPEEFSDEVLYSAPGISKEELYEILDSNNFLYSKDSLHYGLR